MGAHFFISAQNLCSDETLLILGRMTQAKLNQCRLRYISQCLELSPTGALIYHQFRLCTLLCKVIYLINYLTTMAITFCFKKVRFGDALNYLLILKEHLTRFHERYPQEVTYSNYPTHLLRFTCYQKPWTKTLTILIKRSSS